MFGKGARVKCIRHVTRSLSPSMCVCVLFTGRMCRVKLQNGFHSFDIYARQRKPSAFEKFRQILSQTWKGSEKQSECNR